MEEYEKRVPAAKRPRRVQTTGARGGWGPQQDPGSCENSGAITNRIIQRIFGNNLEQICASEQNYPRGTGTEDISRERGLESQLKAAAQRTYGDQEDATDPTMAPQDFDDRQSGRVWELQNSDLWLRPTDVSWIFVSA